MVRCLNAERKDRVSAVEMVHEELDGGRGKWKNVQSSSGLPAGLECLVPLKSILDKDSVSGRSNSKGADL